MTKAGKYENLINALKAYMICWALQLLIGVSVRNPLTVVLFLCAFLGERRFGKRSSLKEALFSLPVSMACGGLITYLAAQNAAAAFESGLFKLLVGVIIFIGIFFLAELIIKAVKRTGRVTDEKSRKKEAPGEVAQRSLLGISEKETFLMTFALCILCYLPYFLYEYPGIMTADSLVQYEQVIGLRPCSNHHPVIHTLCIACFYRIGYFLTGDINKSIAFYTAFQMIFMACCAGRVTAFVRKISKNITRKYSEVLPFLSAAFFAFVPFNVVFAVTIWKDVPFAGITMLLVLTVCDMLTDYEREGGKCLLQKRTLLKFVVLGILFCLFRSNALYGFILSAPFIVFSFRKKLFAVGGSVAAVIILSLILKGPVMDIFNIEQADFVESLSVPLQQVARVLVNDREIPDDDMGLIDEVIDRTYIHELYAPDFADNIKELVRAGHPEVLEQNKAVYLGLWTRLLVRYPADYIAAWFDLVGGYIYPDVSYEVGNIDGIMGNDLGLCATPLIGGRILIKAKEIFIKLGSFMPLYGLLWSAGTYTWILLIYVSYMAANNRRWAVAAAYPLSLIATLCVAAPLADFRYAYGAVTTMPIYAVICAIMIIDKKRGIS